MYIAIIETPSRNKRTLRIAFMGTKGIPALWGGIETYVEELAKRLVERGHAVTVYSPRWYNRGFRGETYFGIGIKRFSTIRIRSAEAITSGAIACLSALKDDYDICHLHNPASYFWIPILKLFGKKVIITIHAYQSFWDTPKFGPLARMAIYSALRVGLIFSDCVTTVSPLIRQSLQSMGINTSIHVLSPGVCNKNFAPPQIIRVKYNIEKENFILFMGRMDKIKRVHWILNAFHDLAPRGIKFVLAGGASIGEERYLNHLKETFKNDPNIIFPGFVSGQEKEEFLTNCRLFILPSKMEGFPLSLLEAMSYKRACLASDIPPHKWVITHKENGYLFPANSYDLFVQSLEDSLWIPKEQLNSVGNAARETVLARFDWDRTVAQLQEIYRQYL